MKTIAVIIPCLNEEKGIAKVLKAIPREKLQSRGFDLDVIVVDNNSTDKTSAVVTQHQARIILETRPGKGRALLTGFEAVTSHTDYIVMLDGDGTYSPAEIFRMIEPLESKFCQVLVGSRLGGKMKINSLRFSNRVANWFFTFLVRQFYFANVTDVLSGYFAFKKEVIKVLIPYLESQGFAIEMELITKCVKLGFEVYSVPITYEKREGDSKLNNLSDGLIIFMTLIKNLGWQPTKHLKEEARLLTV